MTCTGSMRNVITSNFPMELAYREPVVSNPMRSVGRGNAHLPGGGH
jgi:hypothetical protein